MADLSIMYQPITGGWVKLGTQSGGGRGVRPESISMEGDRGEGGCLAAQFTLKQDPQWISAELQAFTPISVWDGAECVWSGRTIMAPTTFGEDDVEVVVQCQGWWQHLKDDCTDREWVIDDLSRWQDIRGLPAARLTSGEDAQAYGVDMGGAIVLSFKNGANYPSNSRGGVRIDLGPSNRAKRLVVAYDQAVGGIAATPNIVMYGLGHDTQNFADAGGALQYPINAHQLVAAGTTVAGTIATATRYVTILLYNVGVGFTAGSDASVRITGIKVFTDTADESGNASILKASTVISETLDAIAPKISRDRSRITTTALNLPQFPGAPGWRYGHELIQQADAPHGYVARLTPDPVPIFEYFPIPTDHRFVVGEGDYALIEPASQDGQFVYNRVISEYEDASGVRSYAQSAPTPTIEGVAQLVNPSFNVDTSHWSLKYAGAAATRDTGVFDTTPASMRLDANGSGQAGALTQTSNLMTLQAGVAYTVRIRWRRAAAAVADAYFFLVDPTGTVLIEDPQASRADAQAAAVGAWVTLTRRFVPTTTASFALHLGLQGCTPSVTAGYVDSVEIAQDSTTVVGRRGFVRTALRPMTHRTTLGTAQAITDLELGSARFPPFKGTITVTGRIPLKGGGSVDVSRLPGMTGENILIKNLLDPNTQALGRVGNIQSVLYDHKTRVAMIGIDRDLRFITQIRDRLATAQR